ncbi:hypothetical protein [Spirulina sp. 06S082]|uniref:hypothetical protein n=1 Tax=Spirulina sp. 06S082 TaxID=3110248 RepID=UPI002B20F450|nr:hypothetical protein [Spirulina sp. 06S082]MEA5470878.1 hypothetical protein [Spirulina sp. 06S082]
MFDHVNSLVSIFYSFFILSSKIPHFFQLYKPIPGSGISLNLAIAFNTIPFLEKSTPTDETLSEIWASICEEVGNITRLCCYGYGIFDGECDRRDR